MNFKNFDFEGLAEMVDESIDRVSYIYKIRPMNGNDVLNHMEILIPRNMVKEGEIFLVNEFIELLYDNYKSWLIYFYLKLSLHAY